MQEQELGLEQESEPEPELEPDAMAKPVRKLREGQSPSETRAKAERGARISRTVSGQRNILEQKPEQSQSTSKAKKGARTSRTPRASICLSLLGQPAISVISVSAIFLPETEPEPANAKASTIARVGPS